MFGGVSVKNKKIRKKHINHNPIEESTKAVFGESTKAVFGEPKAKGDEFIPKTFH